MYKCINVVNGVKPSTLLLNQNAVYLECHQETPEVGSGGGIITMEGLDDVMDGYNSGISAPYGKDHLMDPPSVKGEEVSDRELKVQGHGFGGHEVEGYVS